MWARLHDLCAPSDDAMDKGYMTDGLPPLGQRWAPVLGLFLLSPICGEYLIGYDSSIGQPLQLLSGLLVLGPLYGSVAVFIREVARRTGRGWPTMLLLSAAFGLVQAGVIDQSLFHLEFDPGDPEWATDRPGTPIPLLGIEATNLLNFVGGHVIWTFAAPIAVVEACTPNIADRPWLGRSGIASMVVLYLLGGWVIFGDVVEVSGSAAALIGTACVAVALAVVAFVAPLRGASSPRRAPPWPLAGLAALIVFGATQIIPVTWTWVGVGLQVLLLSLLGGLVWSWSGHTRWGAEQVLAIAGAALLVRAGLSFVVEPLGDVSYSLKLAVNGTVLAGVLVVLLFAWLRIRHTGGHGRRDGADVRSQWSARAVTRTRW